MQPSVHGTASGDLPGRLRSLMKSGPCCAEEAHQDLLELFRDASPEELSSLMSSPDELALTTSYVRSVVDSLDERRLAAASELHDVLGPTAGPTIVGWPE
jgi:hypothetical protein